MAGKGATKAKIIDAAWRLFREKGYHNTTIEDIIASSHTSKSSFYHYFSGKDALLSSLSDYFDDYYQQLMDKADPSMHCFDKLVWLCCSIHRMIGECIQPELLAMLYSSQVVTRGDKHLLDQNRYYFRIIRQIMDEGQRRGEISDKLSQYELVNYYAMCERALIYDYCINDASYDLGEFTARHMPLLLAGIRGEN
ncbi:MAG: TetR/AcrR family transcriptional regulator [Clostridia bacterium]|nr:TetR/AcrR family transcriptional regulator [Clostridia bacterium]